jgi:LysM repeat protein
LLSTVTPEKSNNVVDISPTFRPTDTSTGFITTEPTDMLLTTQTPLAGTLSVENMKTGTSSPTYTVSPCSPPAGWVTYIVQPNDSLFHIGLEFGVTVTDLQLANCLGDSITIYVGQKLYVPYTSSQATPKPITDTPIVSTPYSTQVAPTKVTPTDIATSIPQPTETPEPTFIEFPTATFTPPPPAEVFTR